MRDLRSDPVRADGRRMLTRTSARHPGIRTVTGLRASCRWIQEVGHPRSNNLDGQTPVDLPRRAGIAGCGRPRSSGTVWEADRGAYPPPPAFCQARPDGGPSRTSRPSRVQMSTTTINTGRRCRSDLHVDPDGIHLGSPSPATISSDPRKRHTVKRPRHRLARRNARPLWGLI